MLEDIKRVTGLVSRRRVWHCQVTFSSALVDGSILAHAPGIPLPSCVVTNGGIPPLSNNTGRTMIRHTYRIALGGASCQT